MKTKLNRYIRFAIVMLLAMLTLSACKDKNKANESKVDEDKVNVVATIFPEYDFLRQIAGDHINLTMLLKPGAESHSFEPTPKDIKNVEHASLFVYVGGDSDAWVESILESIDTTDTKLVSLMNCVELVEEEIVEGMTPEAEEDGDEDEEEVEYDEHVWTSPKNSIVIVQKLCDTLCEIDSTNEADYRRNTNDYIKKIENLDKEFIEVVDTAKRKEIIVGDRFPFRYLVEEYGLTYYAAFPGCSTDTEANAATIAFLTDKVKNDEIPVVFHIELSNGKICDSICEETGVKSEQLNAVHNVTKEDFEAGITYLDMMEHNVQVLKEALN